MKVPFNELTAPANIISVISGVFGITALLVVSTGQIYQAIVLSLFALVLDMLDGFVARRTRPGTKFGAQLDTHFDVLNYSVFTAFFCFQVIFTNYVLGLITAITVMVFGVSRLARFSLEGTPTKEENQMFSGLTVTHIYFLMLIIFFIQQQFSIPEYIIFIILNSSGVLMISRIKTHKPFSQILMIVLLILFLTWGLLHVITTT